MIKIDFHGSTHGHFLEYVSNVYIMQTTPSQCSIFKPPTYSAHNPDIHYLNDRMIECGHFSDPNYKLKITDDDQVIRIVINPTDDDTFFIAFTNLMFKAGDVGFEKQLLSIPNSVRDNKIELRNNWYSKFAEREKYANYYTNFLPTSTPVFDFRFEAFFSFKNFCAELGSLANFLNQTFFPDQSLHTLWTEFIARNQGWQSYFKCKQLLEDIFANANKTIDCTLLEEAWINYSLSKMCKLYDSTLSEQESYPTDTQQVYKIIQQHLGSLR